MSRTMAADGERTARPAEFVQSLERGLAVLRAFSAEQPAMTLSEVARTTDLTRATARRLLLTFEALGYMRSDGRYFELTPTGAGPRLRLRLLAEAARHRPAVHGGALRAGARVRLRGRARRRRDRLRGPGADQADHDRLDLARLPPAGGDHLPRAGPPGRAARRPARRLPGPGPRRAPDRPDADRTGRAAGGHRRGPPAGLRRARSGARGRRAQRGHRGAQPPRAARWRPSTCPPTPAGSPSRSSGRSSSPSSWPRPQPSPPSSPASSRPPSTGIWRGIVAPARRSFRTEKPDRPARAAPAAAPTRAAVEPGRQGWRG